MRMPRFLHLLSRALCLGLIAFPVHAATADPGAQARYWRVGNPHDVTTQTTPGFALIGGGKDLDSAFLWLCTRSGKGDFLILRASGDDAYNPYVQSLCHENSVATLLIPSRAAAGDASVRQHIEHAAAIFIAGGDQSNYVNFWMDTPVQAAINDAIRRGVPVGGTSAGLAVLGQFAYSAQHDPADGSNLTSAIALEEPLSDRITIVRNFLQISPLRSTITDSHFSKRDRIGRLLVFMGKIQRTEKTKVIRGVGIDEHTAVLLDPDGHGQVAGTGNAYFLRTTSKPSGWRRAQPFSLKGFTVIRAKAGQTFDTARWAGQGERYELSVKDGKVQSTQGGGAIY